MNSVEFLFWVYL